MTGINHKQAQRYLRAAADGLIRDNQRALLDAHLRECDSCRAEADELKALEARLMKNFQARWDANDGPSTNVIATIQSRSRRIIMTNRINTGLKTAAGLAALLLLIVFLNSIFKQLQEYSQPGAIALESTSFLLPITSTQSSSVELSTPDEFSMTVQEAEALSGFDVLEPSHLPEGYVLQDALYNSQAKLVELRYISSPTAQDSGGPGLIIVYQKRGSFDLGPALHPYETPVSIGDVEGIFIRGAYISEATDGRAYTWDALGDVYTLSWQKDKMAYTISFLGGETIPPIQLNELISIAESMRHDPNIASQETSQPFRFGIPIESKEHALIAAQSGLRTAYRYADPLTVITVEQLSYGEYVQRINQPLNSPVDLKVWFIVYFNNEWQSALPTPTDLINDQGQIVPLPTNMAPSSQFRGCVYMAINANDGSLVEVGGPLQQGIMTECNH